MSDHPDLRPLIESGPRDPRVRRELLLHLRRCSVCRAAVAERSPERLFALLGLEPVPGSILERVSDGVAARVSREAGRRSARRLLAWGSLAASLLLAGVLGTYLFVGTDEAPPPEAVAQRADRPVVAPGEAAVPASMIEVLDSPGKADVVQVTVGDTELVMIFDEALDL